jgi:hypothetical protein
VVLLNEHCASSSISEPTCRKLAGMTIAGDGLMSVSVVDDASAVPSAA